MLDPPRPPLRLRRRSPVEWVPMVIVFVVVLAALAVLGAVWASRRRSSEVHSVEGYQNALSTLQTMPRQVQCFGRAGARARQLPFRARRGRCRAPAGDATDPERHPTWGLGLRRRVGAPCTEPTSQHQGLPPPGPFDGGDQPAASSGRGRHRRRTRRRGTRGRPSHYWLEREPSPLVTTEVLLVGSSHGIGAHGYVWGFHCPKVQIDDRRSAKGSFNAHLDHPGPVPSDRVHRVFGAVHSALVRVHADRAGNNGELLDHGAQRRHRVRVRLSDPDPGPAAIGLGPGPVHGRAGRSERRLLDARRRTGDAADGCSGAVHTCLRPGRVFWCGAGTGCHLIVYLIAESSTLTRRRPSFSPDPSIRRARGRRARTNRRTPRRARRRSGRRVHHGPRPARSGAARGSLC